MDSKLTVAEAKQIADWAKSAEKLIAAAKAVLLEELQLGREVEGWRLGYSRGHRKWSDEQAVEEELLDTLDEDVSIYEPAKLLSPAKLEKAAGREAVNAVAHFIEQSETEVVVPTNSKIPREPKNPFGEFDAS